VREVIMFGSSHYVPILKGKDGEFRALSTLSSDAKARLTPFIDIPRRDKDFKSNLPKPNFDIYLQKKAVKIHKAWGVERPLFIDVYDLKLDLKIPSGLHFVEFFFSELRNLKIKAIPVIGFDRSNDPNYLQAVKNVVLKDNRGLCVRLMDQDLESPTASYAELKNVLQSIGVPKRKIHILFDFRSISENESKDTAALAFDLLAELPNKKEWLTLTLAASSFPQDLGNILPQSTDTISRTEKEIRDLLVKQKRQIQRFPAFGDYGICHPDILDYKPFFTPSAAIRYTLEKEWLIIKAGSIKKYKFDQFRDISKTLRNRADYYGPNYSWGDNYINECAEHTVGKGNLTTWRQVGTNHHITLVGNQIANSPSI